MAFLVLSSVTTSLASLVFRTWKPTTGRSFRRANPRGSPDPSPTSATSDSLTYRPPAVGIVRSRSWSTVGRSPSTRTVCSRPPTSTRPPGMLALNAESAALSSVAVSPCAAIRSGSMITLISRSTPPTRLTWATPFAPCSERETVSSTNQDSWLSDMSGAETA